jgi:hypothetical protein
MSSSRPRYSEAQQQRRELESRRALEELIKVLRKVLDHPDAGVRADRLVDLHDMLEATAIIGGCLKTPAANRLRGANTRKGRSARTQQIEEVVLKVCAPIRAMHPKERVWWVAGEGREQVIGLLGWEVTQDCIADHLTKNWRRLEPSLRPRKTLFSGRL